MALFGPFEIYVKVLLKGYCYVGCCNIAFYTNNRALTTLTDNSCFSLNWYHNLVLHCSFANKPVVSEFVDVGHLFVLKH